MLEIISVVCFSSDEGQKKVADSLDVLWRKQLQSPWVGCVTAIEKKSISVKGERVKRANILEDEHWCACT